MAFFIQTIRRRLANALSPTIERLLADHFGGHMTLAGEHVSHETAMRCAAFWACVKLISETAAQLPLPIYRRLPNGGKERDTTHPLHQLFNVRANAYQTGYEFRETAQLHLLTRGNFIARKTRDALNRNRVIALTPYNPDALEKIDRDSAGRLTYVFRRADGNEERVSEADIFHVRALSMNGLIGIDPLTAYGNSVGLSEAALKHQSKMYANGAKFLGVLTADKKLNDQARKNLKEDFANAYTGDNAFRIPLLEEGLKFQPVSMDAKQMEIMETRRLTRQEIASIFRVPPHMIGDLSGQGYSSVEHQGIEFVTYTMQPWLKRQEACIANQLMDENDRREYFAEHLVDGLLRGDAAARNTAYATAIQNGWMSRNEVRIRENLNPVEGLDTYLVPLNMGSGDSPAPPAN